MLSAVTTGSLATCVAWVARMAMLFVAAHWLLLGDWLNMGVALAAWALSFPATMLLADQLLRNVTTLIVSALLAAHVVLGMYVGLYDSSQFYDKVMHLIGSAAVGVIVIAALHSRGRLTGVEQAWLLQAVLVFAVTLSVGTLWELFEFTVDLTGWFVAQRGLRDTMLDLLANTAGAGLAVMIFGTTRTWRSASHKQSYSLANNG